MEETTTPVEQPVAEGVPEVAQPEAAPVADAPAQPAEEAKPADPKQAFLDEFDALTDRLGLTFSVEPKFKQNPDGSYDTTTVSIQSTIVPKAK